MLLVVHRQSTQSVVQQNDIHLSHCRYDTALPAEFNWNPKQQLDHLVEAQVEMTLAQGFAGRPRANVELLMFNLNTGKQETCPEDWWKHVVQVCVCSRLHG